MAHLLTPAAPTALSANTQKSSLNCWKNVYLPTPTVPCVAYQHQQQVSFSSDRDDPSLRRRAILMGLSGAIVVGLSFLGEERHASAAGRPPPPPPKEKKDPNLSGVQAKVLASKRRKEAMKEEVAKLREKGKAIIKESPPPAPE